MQGDSHIPTDQGAPPAPPHSPDLPQLLRAARDEIGTAAASGLSRSFNAITAGFAEPAVAVDEVDWPGPEVEPELVVCATLALESARHRDRERCADALRRLADWAERRGAVRTAAAAIQLAFHVAGDAMLAHRAGSLARRRADYPRAVQWFERAAEVAADTGNHGAAALASAGRGVVARMTGDLPEAMRWHVQALRIARAHGLRPQEAQALHNLCALSFEMHDNRRGLAFAEMALDAYGHQHSRVAALASDLAWIWMTQEGAFGRALPIFEQLAAEMRDPIDRLYVEANLARAAAGAGDAARYDRAASAVRALLPTIPDTEGHAPALVELAHGAITLGRWRDAAAAAEEAIRIATRRGEARVRAEAAAILENARGHQRMRVLGERTRVADPVEEADVDRLARELLAALSAAA